MSNEEIIRLIKEKEKRINVLNQEIEELKKKIVYENKGYSIEEKLNIYMNYFKGRDDVYSKFSIDSKDHDKKYYTLACANEWKNGICYKKMKKKCSSCPNRELLPLTKETIFNHLYKKETIGIYPLLEDDTCYFLAFDFDDKTSNKNIKEDVLKFIQVCEEYNVPVIMEKSRSGKGIHCWIFFSKRIKALTVRKMGSLLLSKTMENSNLKMESFDRMFPNQDVLPKGGFGNLIALPFQTEAGKLGNTLFVDKDFIPVKNQWEYLTNTRKMNEEEVFNVIENLSYQTSELLNSKINKEETNKLITSEINILFNNMICIEKENLDGVSKKVIKELATFKNPEFFRKQHLRLSTYNTPMFIDCSKEDNKYLKIPRGLFDKLNLFCDENNIKINIEDKRVVGKKITIKFKGKLSAEQEKSLVELLKYENGILKAPTAFGKTVLCCKLIAKRKCNVLIITERIELLRQWKDKIKQFLDFDAGQIGGGENNLTGIIDVASIKTIWNKGNYNEIVNNYGMIIIDECHHLAAYTYENAINSIPAKYVYGVSATPEKENGHTPIIKMQCGDIRCIVDAKEFNKKLKIPMKVIVKKYNNDKKTNVDNVELADIKELIINDDIRNNMILEDIKNEFKKGKNILVLTERIEHLNYLKDKILDFTKNLLIYKGGMGKKLKLSNEKLSDEIKNKSENKIILATGQYIGEGFDDSSLEVLFITMPISRKIKVTQYVGRLHRKNDNKKEILVYDYIDESFIYTKSMYQKRRKVYLSLGYEIVENNL